MIEADIRKAAYILDKYADADIEVSVMSTIRLKIIAVLKIYPKISPSMLQCGIGSSLPATLWRPVLQEMVDAAEVEINHEVHLSGNGRSTSYAIISLVEHSDGSTKTAA